MENTEKVYEFKKPQRRPKRKASPLALALLLWAAGAVPELILHASTAQTVSDFFNCGILLPVLFAVVPALILMFIVELLPWEKVSFGLCIAYSAVYFVLCASQLIYYRVFGTFYSAYSMANGGQVLQFWNIVVKKIFTNLPWELAMALPLIFLCWKGWKTFSFRPVKPWWLSTIPASLAVILQVVLLLSLPLFGGTGDLSAYDLYYNNMDSYYSINRLGFLTAFRVDVTRQLTGSDVGGNIDLGGSDWQNPDDLVPPQTTSPEETTRPSGESTEPIETTQPVETEPPLDTSPNILDFNFEELAANESNSDIKGIHQYFATRTASNKNEYTGMFEGYNLIMITAEAFSYMAVSEELTPTLYKMMTEGFQFTNYYVPDWGTSTTDGEYAFLTGTVPKSNVWSFYRSSNNYMPLTMSMQLIDRGYNAYAYHGHTYSYYKRNQYLTNLGFYYQGYGGDSNGEGNGLNIKKTWPESDLQVVDVTTGSYVANEPFVTYYMTISGHREFTFLGNYIASKNKALVADLPYSSNVRAYLACQMELEFAMELLLQRLEEAGVLDRTLIVLTADHYPNGLTAEEMAELTGHQIDTEFEIYKNALIMWTPNMEEVVVDKPCSHLDLLPTLSNLFGLEFDSRLYMGRDIFSDASSLVMFRNRNWITDYAMYDYSAKSVTSLTDWEVTDEYVKAVNKEVTNRFTVSTRILDNDYWAILFGEN